MKLKRFLTATCAFLLVSTASAAPRKPRVSELSPEQANYLRPGVVVKIVSASIAKDGTIAARFTLTDPKGVPLDREGINSGAAISTSLICAYIPKGQKQYLSYTTTVLAATLPGNKNPSQIQAANDSGGTYAKNGTGDGDYTYTFKTKAPVTFDPTVTHAIGVSARRNLSEFIEQPEWAQVSNDVFNWVPDGSAVKTIRSIVPTEVCNKCHDPLFAHGGSRLTVELCILCHTPQTINPDTLHSQDMPVLIHKIHMGKNLPSVKAGTPYRIWHRGAWSDFSEVGFPSGIDELKNCEVCHQKGAQSDAWMTNPSRAACGSCHDDVDFATGKNHGNLPQASDNLCSTCHQPSNGEEFNITVKGAHTVATRSKQLGGMNFGIVKVANAKPGQKLAVTFTVRDNTDTTIDISKIDRLALVVAGPNSDFNGYITEDCRTGKWTGDGFTYTFNTPLPANAAGSFTVGIEGYRNTIVNPGTTKAATVRDLGWNQMYTFAIGDGKPVARRKVIDSKACLSCHDVLFLHGGNRQNPEYCAVCHNPGVTDSGARPAANAPSESINYKTLIHKIHTGKELATNFTVYGKGASVNNYNEVGYVGDRRNCIKCHLPGTYNLPLPEGLISQVAPRDYFNPMPPITGACLSCHTSKAAAAHAAGQIDPKLGEACEACHGPNNEAAVSKVHAR